jgi:zinc protease
MESVLNRSARRLRSAVAGGLIGLAFLTASAGVSGAAAADPPGVLRATLDNGLKVVIVRNALAAVVTTAVNYGVGADETPAGFPGMAHAQEHMMFRGSPGLTADQLAAIGSLMGGRFNADTRQTVTQYFFTVPAEDLDVALHIEAIRMREVLDADADWAQERGAIEQEVAQDLSSPRYILYTRLRQAMFKGTPYEHDGLGTRPSFEKTTGAMLKAFHDAWYAPNNAVLIVAGDVDPPAALAKIKALFGPIPSKKLPPRPTVKLQPIQPQTIKLETDLPYGLLVTAFRLPGIKDKDYAAVEVLADVLSSERGALFDLVPQGKALYADFSMELLPEAGLGYAAAAFPAGGDPQALEREMRAILARIAKEGMPADLVEAAKVQERREAEFAKNSIEGLATIWSEAIAVYGLDSPDDDLARIEKVTVGDVNRIARQYLDLDHAVVAVLTPQGADKPVAQKGFGGKESIALTPAKPTQLPDWAEKALAHLSVPPSTVRPTVSTLPNGITLIVQPEDVSDTVSVYGRIRTRPELSVPSGQEGMSLMLDQLFGYGTEHLDRIAFQRALDDIGAEARAGTSFEMQTLKEHFARGVELLADNELHPAFPAEAFKVVQRQAAETVAGQLASPSYQASHALRTALFPKGDPMLRQATPESIGTLTPDALRAYYVKAFRPDLTTIVVIGKVTPEEARATIEKYFGGWKSEGAKPATDLPAVPPSGPTAIAVPDASRVQDQVTLAQTLGLNRANPDYYALELGNTVLGGSFYATRLTRDLRKQAGLVYAVGTSLDVGKTRSLYLVGYACDPQNVSRVAAIIQRELEDMQTKPVTPDELQMAKALLLRQIPLDESSVGEIAGGLLERAALDLPFDEPTRAAKRFLALGAGEVQAAFKKWLRPADLARVSRGPTPE